LNAGGVSRNRDSEPVSDIERVTQATLLGIDITSTLSTAARVCKQDATANKPAFIPLVTAQVSTSQGTAVKALHQLFTDLV